MYTSFQSCKAILKRPVHDNIFVSLWAVDFGLAPQRPGFIVRVARAEFVVEEIELKVDFLSSHSYNVLY
jgi:hypothetical protein